MLARYSVMSSLAALSLTALGMTALPVYAHAQDNEDTAATSAKVDPSNKKIDLSLESTNLYYALKLLFGQIKANYVLDESLRNLTVTAHLTNVPFRVALETLLKSTNVPLTYTVDNGIYNIKPKVESPEPTIVDGDTKTVEPPTRDGYRIHKIHSTSLSFNAIDLVQAFGGKILTVGQGTGQFGQGGLGGGMGGLGSGGLGGGGFGGFGNGGFGNGYGGMGSGGLGGFGNGGVGNGGFNNGGGFNNRRGGGGGF